MLLQQGLPVVDDLSAMGPADTAPRDRGVRRPQDAVGGPISVRQLAHELNSLLDGSLRCLNLALETPAAGMEPEAVERLLAARDAMWQMAELLGQAMRSDLRPAGVLRRASRLDREVRRVTDLVRPLAAGQGVEIRARVAPAAAGLPAGPLGAVMLNGLRNAIRACGSGRPPRRVELAAEAGGPGVLRLTISDTGPGWPAEAAEPQEHGLGLALCRRVVTDLGGRLRCRPGPDGAGARLCVEVPVESLRS